MLSYRLGTVTDFHWELKPVLSYSKPNTSKVLSTFYSINVYVVNNYT